METFNLDPIWVRALGMMILHSLWQVSLLITIYYVANRIYRFKASHRYSVGMVTVGLIAFAMVMTLLFYLRPIDDNSMMVHQATMITISPIDAVGLENNSSWQDYLPVLVQSWTIGFILLMIYRIIGFGYTIYLRKTALPDTNTARINLLEKLTELLKLQVNES